MRRSHTRPADPGAHLRFERELADLLASAGDAWAQFLCDCYHADKRESYGAFWVGPEWFLQELGEPFLNAGGRRFETMYWIEWMRSAGVHEEDILQNVRLTSDEAVICNLLRPIIDSKLSHTAKTQLVSVDHRALAHVRDLAENHDRYYRYEIDSAARNAAYELLPLGSHTPEALVFKWPDEENPRRTRNPSLDLFSDVEYWKGRYPSTISFASDAKELISRRWYSELMPLVAPEFVFDKSLSAPKSIAYVLPCEGDWAWAILVDSTDRFQRSEPELGLLWRSGGQKSKGLMLWQPLSGQWFRAGLTRFYLAQALRGIEVNLMWLVRHYKRLIRFYEPYLIEYLATRGETLLPAFKE
jgi:hypothetical protein